MINLRHLLFVKLSRPVNGM